MSTIHVRVFCPRCRRYQRTVTQPYPNRIIRNMTQPMPCYACEDKRAREIVMAWVGRAGRSGR